MDELHRTHSDTEINVLLKPQTIAQKLPSYLYVKWNGKNWIEIERYLYCTFYHIGVFFSAAMPVDWGRS